MNNKLITILAVFLCSTAYSQNIFSDGNRVFTTDSSVALYTRYEINGFESRFVVRDRSSRALFQSGKVRVAFEGISTRFMTPILFGGENIVYCEIPFSDVSVGDKLYKISYRVINNELDGLHYIDGVKFDKANFPKTKWQQKRDKFAVIAGNIVDTHRDDLEKEGHRIGYDYMFWLIYGLNLDLGQSPFPHPEVHKEEDLYFDLETMVQIFLDDYHGHLFEFAKELAVWQEDDDEFFKYWDNIFLPLNELLPEMEITAVFEKLESGVIAKSFGIDDDENIIIKVDPDQWLNADLANRWYILYHELGHDVLNFRHGQGGRMMFNYPTKKYSWEDFFNDRDEMFLKALNKTYPQAKKDGIQPSWSNY